MATTAIPPGALALAEKQGIEWFDAVCEVLKRANRPTVHAMWKLFGGPDGSIPRHRRIGQFLAPFDRRFDSVSLNPDIDERDPDAPLNIISFVGGFSLNVGDIARRFPRYRRKENIRDGGTQIFFHPIPREFEFTAVDVWTQKEGRIWLARKVFVQNVSFQFGDTRVEWMDGYHMIRRQ